MLILKTLERNAESMHGYAIARYIKQISGDVLRVEEGSLYPALQRLLKAGCVEARWEVSERGRRVRRYELTAEGARRLDHEVSSFERMLEGIRLVLSPNEQ